MRLIFSAFILTAAAGVAAAPVPFAPKVAGVFAAGGGADAFFAQIDGDWRGSTVLWDETSRTYGSGEPIGSFAWGTGLWGLNDWNAAVASANGASGPAYPPIVAQWSGVAPQINYGNAMYNCWHADTWGRATLVPLFTASDCRAAQENWIARFSGYIRVTEPGAYSFGVLNDDGFFFRLVGAGGATQEVVRDYLNPRDRNGFDDELLLDVGLYGFELGAWNRLEAGVVDLRWSTDGGETWTLVPTTSLLSANAVPTSSTWMLVFAGLAAWVPVRSRQRRK